MLRITNAIAIEERAIEERFVRAMGKDGQNANRASTAVELRLDLATSSLPAEVKERLIELAGRHVTRGGVLVVVSRDFRSQLRNREAAREMLVKLVAKAATEPARRAEG